MSEQASPYREPLQAAQDAIGSICVGSLETVDQAMEIEKALDEIMKLCIVVGHELREWRHGQSTSQSNEKSPEQTSEVVVARINGHLADLLKQANGRLRLVPVAPVTFTHVVDVVTEMQQDIANGYGLFSPDGVGYIDIGPDIGQKELEAMSLTITSWSDGDMTLVPSVTYLAGQLDTPSPFKDFSGE